MEPIHVETVDGELRLLESPWDPVARKFKGERVYFYGADLGAPSDGPSS